MSRRSDKLTKASRCDQCAHPDLKGLHTCGRDRLPWDENEEEEAPPTRRRPPDDDDDEEEAPVPAKMKSPLLDRGAPSRPENRVLVGCPCCAADLLVESNDPDDELPPLRLTFLRHNA
jgi:hypothetical protein